MAVQNVIRGKNGSEMALKREETKPDYSALNPPYTGIDLNREFKLTFIQEARHYLLDQSTIKFINWVRKDLIDFQELWDWNVLERLVDAIK